MSSLRALAGRHSRLPALGVCVLACAFACFPAAMHATCADDAASFDAFWARLSAMDANGDGRVERAEFRGPATLWKAIDLDASGATDRDEAQHAFRAMTRERAPAHEPPSAPPTLAGIPLRAVDMDQDGKADLAEWGAFFRRSDLDGDGSIDEAEWRAAVQRAGREDPAPAVGERVPQVAAQGLTPKQGIDLAHPARTTVLVFGSWTCDLFAAEAPALRRLRERYGDRFDFRLVYTREAHPSDGGRPSPHVSVPQTRTRAARVDTARRCVKALSLDMPVLVDDPDDTLAVAFHALPERAFVIGTDGRVLYRSAHGPGGLDPAALDRALEGFSHASD